MYRLSYSLSSSLLYILIFWRSRPRSPKTALHASCLKLSPRLGFRKGAHHGQFYELWRSSHGVSGQSCTAPAPMSIFFGPHHELNNELVGTMQDQKPASILRRAAAALLLHVRYLHPDLLFIVQPRWQMGRFSNTILHGAEALCGEVVPSRRVPLVRPTVG
ncbi:uncharacterized protein LAESUDRAFT_452035 [Laetiporus sulphureus 93-53]|uniref:Uncharacterized protein n=1 Tax=Laetiporus sulphureus 93-53 TaxID=1314785 RepID=A0A165BXM9_9APHY|nr:uncharacterized protein LAESUDRAFT_452035 [Laetiporus sulphureus 93-53]KZT01841.1 hypothetical protein LAESUDRAFT_452035 [Laetiporus sulphureus 93-53]